MRGNSDAARMGGQPVSIVGSVTTGQTYDLWVNLTAPNQAGVYVGYWQMNNGASQAFGETFVVAAQVPGPTPAPTATQTPTKVPTATPEEPTEEPTATETETPPEATATEVPPEPTATEVPSEPTETPVPGAEIMDILWEWVSWQIAAPPSQTAIEDQEDYNLVLLSTGLVTAKADCNSLQGTYEITETELTFDFGPYTQVACSEGSLSDDYIQLLLDVDRWQLDSAGDLFLGSGEGSGDSSANVLGFSNEGPAPTP